MGPFEENTISSQRRQVIMFDEKDHLDKRSAEGIHFLALLNIYRRDMYKHADSDTHRSIVRSTILEEIKSQGYTFGKTSSSLEGRVVLVDDMYALNRIRHYLKVMK